MGEKFGEAMFECALFGMCRERLALEGLPFHRVERVYESSGRKAVVYVEKKQAEVAFYEIPDRNKQRMSIVRETRRFSLKGSYDEFLKAIGYTRVCGPGRSAASNAVEGFRYCRSGYTIELSRLRRATAILDSSEEEEEMRNEIVAEMPGCLYEYYLVKVFVLTENVIEGEEILNSAFIELNDVVKLTKPSLLLF